MELSDVLGMIARQLENARAYANDDKTVLANIEVIEAMLNLAKVLCK